MFATVVPRRANTEMLAEGTLCGLCIRVRRKNNVLRGTIKDRSEAIRLSDEIMKLLIKRQTSLADGSDALTIVMLNAVKANYGGARGERVGPAFVSLLRRDEEVLGIDEA
jgi:hypothetical protein